MSREVDLLVALLEEGFELVSGGTDNHLMLVKLIGKGITGRDAANLLEQAGICLNKNTIPNDPLSPAETSGIRPGTPALTTRGMRELQLRFHCSTALRAKVRLFHRRRESGSRRLI